MRRYAQHESLLPGTQPIRWREVVRDYPCPTCEAAPGEDCTTQTGNRKYEAHAARSRLASRDGWHLPQLGQTPTQNRGQVAKSRRESR